MNKDKFPMTMKRQTQRYSPPSLPCLSNSAFPSFGNALQS